MKNDLVILFFAFVACGCSEVALTYQEKLSAEITENEIRKHIYSLASDEMNGRQTGTRGWQAAQKYIVDRFTELRLRPWGNAKSHRLPFKEGVNVAGVLDGSSSEFMNEYVIVCAHYDHIGRGSSEAGDNASGVAALIEIAEMLVMSGYSPKRNICFVAFDCEEKGLLGSNAFWERKDVDNCNITACVNIDTLGRGVLDRDRTLFMLRNRDLNAVEDYFTNSAAINRLAVQKASLAPFMTMGDHFIFAINGVPTFLFSNGPHKDLHGLGDSPEYLDCTLVCDDARVIGDGLKGLLDCPEIFGKKIAAYTSDGDLELIRHVLNVYLECKGEFSKKTVFGYDLTDALCEAIMECIPAINRQLSLSHDMRDTGLCGEFFAMGLLAYSVFMRKR